MEEFDVIVVGGGNAGLCAALAASGHADRVLLVEKAPIGDRGGNTKYTRDVRFAHDDNPFTTGPYSDEEFFDDILKVTARGTNLELARLVVGESRAMTEWMERQGIRWQRSLKGALHLSRTNIFLLGGGKALVNTYYARARKLGVTVMYDSEVTDLLVKDDVAVGVKVNLGDKKTEIHGKSIVATAGGFEVNLEWLRRYWGDVANNFIVRGSSSNDGRLLTMLLENGAESIGNQKDAHMVAVDARSPKFDGGIVTRVDSVPLGIVINRLGKRFYDEGEDEWSKKYAIWGRLIAEQPEQAAYSIFDSKMLGEFIPPAYEPYAASTIDELARKISVEPSSLGKTIHEFNDSVVESSSFDLGRLDCCRTTGLDPPKSHWARRIDRPPYYVYPLRPGITFTYAGVAVDRTARVKRSNGGSFKNVFAAGECMAGNILSSGYLGGLGMCIGTVFGKIAGEEASKIG